ncbi:MAG: hypothetical protein PQJ59_02345 [Spirochaetales bacterium]|nr:hypothetical protein [Spirochaetales bacterium]
MLQAILNNKIQRSLSVEDDKIRIAPMEDTLTSSVFGNLLYLPSELLLGILDDCSYSSKLTKSCGPLEEYSFWPNWQSDDQQSVQPDLFLRFSHCDLIIEAKRLDHNQQSRKQWENEVRSYYKEYGEENKKVVLLAIGGLTNTGKEQILNDVDVVKISWNRLLASVSLLKKCIEKMEVKSSSLISQVNILSDIISYFEYHGYFEMTWFEDFSLKYDTIQIDDRDIRKWNSEK